MSRKSKQRMLHRWREVRDLSNHLRKHYNRDTVMQFFERNYFYGSEMIDNILRNVDKQPVDPARCTITYLTAMRPDFDIRNHIYHDHLEQKSPHDKDYAAEFEELTIKLRTNN